MVQKTRVIKSKKYRNTNSSPYLDFIAKNGGTEPPDANPDVLNDEQGIQYGDKDTDEEFKILVVKRALRLLTKREREVVNLCAFQGYSLEEAAALLSMGKSSAQVLLERARKRITKEWKKHEND